MVAPTRPRVLLQPQDKSTIGRLAGVAVLLLYAYVFQAGNYVVTVGGLFVPVVLLFSLRRISFSVLPFFLGVFFIGWPALVMLGSSFVGAALSPEPLRFAASYALWVVSILLLMFACVTRSPVELRWILPVQLILTFLMAVQFIGARFFSNMFGFEIVAPLIANDIFNSYLGLNFQSSVRAIGTYYEPSMCARVMGTLCFLDLMRNSQVMRNFLFLGLTMLFTQSLGLVVMAAVLGGIMLGRSWREFGLIVISGGLVAVIAAPMIGQRSTIDEGSNYVRVIAPIQAVEWAVTTHILGLPIGSMEDLAASTGYTDQTGEHKISNGIYEFLIYFGLLGIAAIVTSGIYVVILLVSGERELAAALAYLVLSTGLSSSFLSIESSLLTYFFIAGSRNARRHRRARQSQRLKSKPPSPTSTLTLGGMSHRDQVGNAD